MLALRATALADLDRSREDDADEESEEEDMGADERDWMLSWKEERGKACRDKRE